VPAQVGPRNPLRPWPPELGSEELDAALASVAAYLDQLRAQGRELTGPSFRNGLAWCYALCARYAEALHLVRGRLALQPADETALGIGSEILVQWKLGVLRFHADDYLHLPGPEDGAPRPLGDSPVPVEEAAHAARRAGLDAALLDLQHILAARLQARGRAEAARAVMARAERFRP
jgi:hypothetical protein